MVGQTKDERKKQSLSLKDGDLNRVVNVVACERLSVKRWTVDSVYTKRRRLLRMWALTWRACRNLRTTVWKKKNSLSSSKTR